MQRVADKVPITLSTLQLGDDIALLQLPGECFVEYQLFAQEQRPGGFVAVAAYGDDGPWYLPTAKAYPEGGYEPSAAFAGPEAEGILRSAIIKLLAK